MPQAANEKETARTVYNVERTKNYSKHNLEKTIKIKKVSMHQMFEDHDDEDLLTHNN